MANGSIDPALRLVKSASRPLADRLAKTRITPDMITLANFIIITPICVIAFSQGTWSGYLIGLAACIMHGYLDFIDGLVARSQGSQSIRGEKLDTGLDIMIQLAVLCALAFGIFRETQSPAWLVVGLFTVFAQGASNFLGFEINHDFGFTSHSGSAEFRQRFQNSGHQTRLIAAMVAPASLTATMLLTVRYPLVFGAVLNLMPYAMLYIAISTMIRVAVGLWVYFDSFTDQPASEISRALKEFSREAGSNV